MIGPATGALPDGWKRPRRKDPDRRATEMPMPATPRASRSLRTLPATLVLIAMMLAVALLVGWLWQSSRADARARDEAKRDAAAARFPHPLSGVNLAGAEFNANKIPGRANFDYAYPNADVAAPFIAAGMKAVRVPMLWERLQPALGADFDQGELDRLDQTIATLKPFQMVVIDVHNYGYYRGRRLDSAPELGDGFAAFWATLAKHYKGRGTVAFGLMNEPHDLDARAWRPIVDKAVKAIRATGAKNLILVPGVRWTGAHSWLDGGDSSNAAAFASFRDPANRSVIEMHQYMDRDSSGTSADCVSEDVGAQRLEAATKWLRDTGHRGFLGEFGGGDSPVCLAALDGRLTMMDRNRDVWMGWTYWAGGGWWGNYFASIQPEAGKGPRPQMQVIQRYIDRVR
jgi:endoglucanase